MTSIFYIVLCVLLLVLELCFRSKWSDDVSALPENLSAAPSGGKGTKIIRGIIIPLLLAAWGIECMIEREFIFRWSTFRKVELHDERAVAMGIGIICLGCFAHFQWFWGLTPKLCNYIDIPKALSLLGFVICMGYAYISAIKQYY